MNSTTEKPLTKNTNNAGEFCLPRFESVMSIQGFTYDQLSKEMGCDVKRYATGKNPMPLNLLCKCCDFMECNKDYILMLTNEPNCKPIKPTPVPKRRKVYGDRIEFNFDKKLLIKRIESEGWTLRAFASNLSSKIKFTCKTGIMDANSLTPVDYNNILFLLRCDAKYLTGNSDTVNQAKIPKFNSNFIAVDSCIIDHNIFNGRDLVELSKNLGAALHYIEWLSKENRIVHKFAGEWLAHRMKYMFPKENIKASDVYTLGSSIGCGKSAEEKPKNNPESTVAAHINPVSKPSVTKKAEERIGTPLAEAMAKAGVAVSSTDKKSTNNRPEVRKSSTYYAGKHTRNNYNGNNRSNITLKDVLTYIETLSDEELDNLAEYATTFKKMRQIKKNLIK